MYRIINNSIRQALSRKVEEASKDDYSILNSPSNIREWLNLFQRQCISSSQRRTLGIESSFQITSKILNMAAWDGKNGWKRIQRMLPMSGSRENARLEELRSTPLQNKPWSYVVYLRRVSKLNYLRVIDYYYR